MPPLNFFCAAAVAFNVQFFDTITEFLVFNSLNIKKRQCSGVPILFAYLFYVTGVHDPVVLWTIMSRLSAGWYWRYHNVLRYQKFSYWYRVCLNTYSRQKVHTIAEMAISIVIFCICAGMIPGVDPWDKWAVAFGAIENFSIFKKSPKCGNERLVS